MKSKFTTIMLTFFLGGLGIHRFYLGQNKLGLFYLLFFWTFIPAIIALIDFFAFIFMTEDSFNYKYNIKTGF
jgi:TM2 domain-containing membrane protein YozV